MSTFNISKRAEARDIPNSHLQNSGASLLRELIMDFRATQLISAAAKLSLADHLKDGPKTAEHLSEIAATDLSGLYRLLRKLSGVGIFEEHQDTTFSTTSLGVFLRKDAPGSLRSLAILYGEEWRWRAYAKLVCSIENEDQLLNRE
jgi:hypothetical protein